MSLASLQALSGVRVPRTGSDDNTHHQRVVAKPYRITLEGRLLSGHADVVSALRRLAVLNRDGELDGYEVTRRGKR